MSYYNVDAWNSSKIRSIKGDFKNLEKPFIESTATILGTAVHSYVLEGKREFSIAKTKTLTASYNGEDILNGQLDTVIKCGEALLSHSKIETFGSKIEKEYYFELFGENFKAKIDTVDGVVDGEEVILDIKTINDIQDSIKRIKYDYYIQSWIYKKAVEIVDGEIKPFYFAFVQTKEPYTVKLINVVNDDHAEAYIEEILTKYNLYTEFGININDDIEVF